MLVYEVDQFTSQQAQEEFSGRLWAVIQTSGALGLQGIDASERPALAFGGGALTMQGLDAFVPGYGLFDLDVVVGGPMFKRLASNPGFNYGVQNLGSGALHGEVKRSPAIPLYVDVLHNSPTNFSNFIGDIPYTGEPNDSVIETPLGLRVLYASIVASKKSSHEYARIKDLGGLVKAQVVADHKEHPILDDPLWLESIGLAMERLANNNIDKYEMSFMRRITGRGPVYPTWLKQLIKTDFKHPAFANVPVV